MNKPKTSQLSAFISGCLTGSKCPPNLWVEVARDPDKIVSAAANGSVLQALHGVISHFPLAIPKEISDLVGTVHALNSERNRAATTQFLQLTHALSRVGIEHTALKGIANILAGIYPDTGTRYLSDIDLLINPDHFTASLPIFQDLGYSANATQTIEFNIGHTYPPFTRPGSFEIDVHRTLGLPPCPTFLPTTELIRASVVGNLDGVPVQIPCPTHLLTHHIMHSQMHDVYRERIAPSLRTLYDFHLLQSHLGSQIDWSEIEARFVRNRQYPTLALYLLQFQETFHLDPPIPLRITASIRLRHRRRQILQDSPRLRLLDPTYYYFAGLKPRTRRLREILSQPQGIHYLLQKFINPAFYHRLKSDFRA